ncbi:MAG: hypothetical protein ABIE70_13780 [bacterium]
MNEMIEVLTASDNWLSTVMVLVVALLGLVVRRYVLPLLKVERQRRYARWVATIADEVTDDLRERYPESEWLKYLDEAVDALVEVCRVDQTIARRAIHAALARGRD